MKRSAARRAWRARHHFQHEIEVATNLARRAGELILAIYPTDFGVSSKGEAGPVTEADRRANDLIVEELARAFPDDAVVSEEAEARGPHRSNRVWYVDPLDGTHEFVARNGEFSVLIGLAVEGMPRLGVIYQPDDLALFVGIADHESWLEQDGQRFALTVSDIVDPRQLRLVVSRSHRHSLIDEMRARIGIEHESRCGSVGVKIGQLVRRVADVYLEPAGYTHGWDLCGPEAVLQGAGGQMTDLSGCPLVYDRHHPVNRRGVVATNAACHDHVITAISPIVHTPR